jgi:multiple sugar transport system ATP-binding protein
MGRAIVRHAKVFLFDEPLSNLDAKLRVQMRTEIKKLHLRLRTTTVYVTHDQVEAMTLADRVVVMNNGRIEQAGAPTELYTSPRTRFVAGFIGSPAMNFIPCALERSAGALRVAIPGGPSFAVPAERTQRYAAALGKKLLLGLRPEHITDVGESANAHPGVQGFETTLDVTEPMGMETLIYFPLAGAQICGRVDPTAGALPGRDMKLVADLRHMHLIDDETGLVL